ncbi:hypothetical protein niasHT_007606 [Heterodera trifolii]|uniref:PCI domain-containing protein n=1 Tax=Heterodera trifolii TaxID=157864 RepID=A0ABD2LPN4_9BILA
MEKERDILVSLASKHRTVPYDVLMNALKIANEREFEDFIIESIYQDIIQGRLNPIKRHLEIYDWKNEKVGDFQFMAETLNQWDKHCGNFLNSIGTEMIRSNNTVAEFVAKEKSVNEEIENIRKTFSYEDPKKFLGDKDTFKISSKPEAKKFKGMKNKKPGN